MSDKNITVLQWNARSITKNLPYLQQELSKNVYHVLLLQSLNVTKSNLPTLEQFYYPPVTDVCQPEGRIQTAIYVRLELQYCTRSSPVPRNIPSISSCAITVKFSESTTMNMASVYLPSGPDDCNTEWLRAFPDQHNKWLISGDFNAHAPFWETNCLHITSNRMIENIVDSSLYLLNDGSFTRIPDVPTHRPTSIDLTLISPQMASECCWKPHSDTLGSDHLPINIIINEKLALNDRSKDALPKYNYKYADWSLFETMLKDYDTSVCIDDDINVMYETFCKTVLNAADTSIPKISSTTFAKYLGNVWWTRQCEQAVKEKKQKYKDYIRNRSTESHEAMKYSKIRCNRVIAQAKLDYWNSFCQSEILDHKDLQKVWKKIDTMRNGIKLPNCPVQIGNKQFPTVAEKSEAFVDMFASVSRKEGLTEANRMYRDYEENTDEYKDPHSDNTVSVNAPLTLQEILDAIRSISNKKTSVGADAISNEMIKHLPENWVVLLHLIFQKCWQNGIMPEIFKQSIVVPIHKQGKSRIEINSYRPIALTSHVCKLMEKIILNRLLHFCERNNVIPKHQAGFRKGRSTIDHLVKLTTQIKHQFARRKGVLATFIDITKAYDQVWHSRLLYKLKSFGISGHMYNYVKCFLRDRIIQAKVGNTYSSTRTLQMGIPQGSVIAPLLFNILLHDFPNFVPRSVQLVQYADDICIWMPVTLKKKTPVRSLNYTRRVYQNALDKIAIYMKNNGLKLSVEKTNMMLFNSGLNPDQLPSFKVDNTIIQYKESVKFLGIYLTSKLSWNPHISYILTKARKSLNFLKIVSKQPWGQDPYSLIHLSTSLIRSKLTYGHEIFFSAPKYLLQKLQSIDCKSYKLALGLPMHASCMRTYQEAGILPLNDQRQLASAKYILRSLTNNNNMEAEVKLRSDIDFPKRAKSITSQTTIATYTSGIFDASGIKLEKNTIAARPSFFPTPVWELQRAKFDIDHSQLKKDTNVYILANTIKSYIDECYHNHFKLYTDGSLLENKKAGAAYIIPGLNIVQSFHLGENISIFTAELVAILMALNYLVNFRKDIFQVLFCVDSKSVLYALRSLSLKVRPELVMEISHLVHVLSLRGTDITFCWIPSHSGFYYNEKVDNAAKLGASKSPGSTVLNIPLSLQEFYHIVEKTAREIFVKSLKKYSDNEIKYEISNYKVLNRHITSLIYRWKFDAFRTKYTKNTSCTCGHQITPKHILSCRMIKQFIPSLSECAPEKIFSSPVLTVDFFSSLLKSPIGSFL